MKLREQCNLIFRDGHQIVRRDDDCQHQGGRELGQSDMANLCESLQRRELKQAKGADMPEPKKVCGQVQRLTCSLSQMLFRRRMDGA